MTLIVLLIVSALVVQLALWLAIKYLRQAPGDARSASPSATYSEAAWWLAGTLIVIILLGLLLRHVYYEPRNPQPVAPEATASRLTSAG